MAMLQTARQSIKTTSRHESSIVANMTYCYAVKGDHLAAQLLFDEYKQHYQTKGLSDDSHKIEYVQQYLKDQDLKAEKIQKKMKNMTEIEQARFYLDQFKYKDALDICVKVRK